MVLHAIMFPQQSKNENVVSSEISEVLSPGDFMKTIVRHGDGSYLPQKGVGVEGIMYNLLNFIYISQFGD